MSRPICDVDRITTRHLLAALGVNMRLCREGFLTSSIIACLSLGPGEVYTVHDLVRYVYGERPLVSDPAGSIRVGIYRLRKAGYNIVNVVVSAGRGYALREWVRQEAAE